MGRRCCLGSWDGCRSGRPACRTAGRCLLPGVLLFILVLCSSHAAGRPRGLAKRVIACLDVRANDNGDLVVTKGDQYDVREATSEEGGSSGEVSARSDQAGTSKLGLLAWIDIHCWMLQ
jgi:hypothetical protein